MNVELQESFLRKLNRQIAYIAKDKPDAARKFKNDVLQRVKLISNYPFMCKQSIYHDHPSIRDLIFKGYTIVYKVEESKNLISVFALIKHQEF